jgi:hypothetical protein
MYKETFKLEFPRKGFIISDWKSLKVIWLKKNLINILIAYQIGLFNIIILLFTMKVFKEFCQPRSSFFHK